MNAPATHLAVHTSASEVGDEELFARYREQADLSAFDALVHRYERQLYSYLHRYLRDPGLAEEVFQTTFLHVVEKSRSFEPGRRFRPWLYSIATHAAIDTLRHRSRRTAASLDALHGAPEGEAVPLARLIEDQSRSPSEQLIDEERRREVRRAVDALPDDLRDVLLLAYFQGLTYRETAEALGLPIGTVKSRMHAALQRLGIALREGETVEKP